MLPAEPRERARIEMRMDWQATEFNSSWRYAFQALVRKNPAFSDATELRAGLRAWSRNIEILDAQLARTHQFVAGDRFTLADIPIGLAVNPWFMTPIEDRRACPAVSDYARFATRAAYLAHGRNGTP